MIAWQRTGSTYVRGPWRVDKSFYADGPSMFEWILVNDDRTIYESHPTLREAKAAAERYDRAEVPS